ncbi:MAG: ABC transporter ATP-binding protein [Candidatus Rokubacteria bacterium]|nr:ABC transporter ATP-binding protein [Candidatus Rokubacteria bacterium]
MIDIRRLEKSFGALRVLQGIDLRIRPGQVTALVGPNAAGKTTLIKCVVGLVVPDAGEIRIDGVPIRGAWAYREKIGYMAQVARFPENLTVAEVLRLVKDLRESPAKNEALLLGLFGLHAFLGRPLRGLSGGTRQKVNLVLAMMCDPEILILDEPTVGLDPLASRRQKDRILEERARGKTVVLASHAMGEIEELSDRVVFLLEGRVYFDGTPAELRARTGEATLERAIARLLERDGR